MGVLVNTNSSLTRGRLFIIGAAILWSLSGMFTKSIALPGPTIACYRVLAAGLVLLPFVKWSKIRWRPAMFGMIACFSLMNVSFISAMTLTTAANAIFLQYTAPLWIFLAGVLWLKEPTDRMSIVSLVLSMSGIAVILLGQEQEGLNLGIALALIAGISYAGVAIFLRYLRDEDSVFLTVLNMLGSGLVLFVALAFWPSSQAESLLHIKPDDILPLIAFGVIQMAAPYFLFSRGLNGVTAQDAAILTLIEPLLNPLITYWTIGEVPQMATLLGGGVILLGVASRFVYVRKEKVEEAT